MQLHKTNADQIHYASRPQLDNKAIYKSITKNDSYVKKIWVKAFTGVSNMDKRPNSVMEMSILRRLCNPLCNSTCMCMI